MSKKGANNTQGEQKEGDGVAISLYHYNDDNKILVYLDKDKKKSRRKPKFATPGYSSMTEGDVTQENREKAVMLAQNAPLLRRKLRNKTFLEACRLRGVDPADLAPRGIASFKTLPNRAQELSPAEQQVQYNAYETERLHLLGLVVSQEEASIEKIKADKAKAKRQRQKQTQQFAAQIQRERDQLERMNRSRAKYERVLESENKKINSTRKTSLHHKIQNLSKTRRIAANKEKMKSTLRQRGKAREARIKRSVQERRKLDETWKRKQEARILERYRQVDEFVAKKNSGFEARLEREKAREQKRKASRARAKKLEEQRRQMMSDTMRAKEAHVASLKLQKEQERKQQKTQRALKSKQRMKKAERVRAAKLYQKQTIAEKLRAKEMAMAEIQEMRKAVKEKRKQIIREENIRRDMWKARTKVERALTPGPGEYDIPDSLSLITGGSFNKSNPKTDLEWVEYRAKQIPGPGRYMSMDQTSGLNKAGGAWSKYKPKSDVEWAMERAAKTPGPGEYRPKPVEPSYNTTFGNFEPKSELDWVIHKAKDTPAPGQHQPSVIPPRNRTLKELTKDFGISNKAALFAARLKKKLKTRRSRTAAAIAASPNSASL